MTPGGGNGVIATLAAAAAAAAAVTTWQATAPPDRRKRPVAEIVSRGILALAVIVSAYLLVQITTVWKPNAAAGAPLAPYRDAAPRD